MLISLAATTVSAQRQRKVFDQQALRDLAHSIEQRGLLHAPVFVLREGEAGTALYQLVAGERRYRAIQLLHAEARSFHYNGEAVLAGMIPATLTHRTGRIERREAELDENIIRVDLSWQERTAALADLHALRTEQNPKQTVRDTATEVARIQGVAESDSGAVYTEVRMANIIAKHLGESDVSNARSASEAYKMVLAREESLYRAEIMRRQAARISANPNSLRCDVQCVSIFDALPRLDDACVDLILTDPPYGIGAHTANYRARTEQHHTYEDTDENAKNILHCILTEGWRVTRANANLFIFTDIKHFAWLQSLSARMGWSPWRRPIIWRKSASEGLTPWGRHGFAITYDVIFYAKKGQPGLRNRYPDILDFPRVKRGDRVYAAEKPLDLLKKLIELSTMPGDMVLDPCSGSGSTLIAAKQMSRPSLGFEIAQSAVDLTLARIQKGDSNVNFDQYLATTEEPADALSDDDASGAPDATDELPEL